MFHTDRGNEFKNQTIEELPETFDIERSLSQKGCPYDNAVAEATFKIIKTEFVWNETFANLKEWKLKLWDYVNWYDHHRVHSAFGYQTPYSTEKTSLKKLSKKVLTIHYIRDHKKVLDFSLMTSGKLNRCIADIDQQAQERFFRRGEQLAERKGMTEQLKAENQMEWVG